MKTHHPSSQHDLCHWHPGTIRSTHHTFFDQREWSSQLGADGVQEFVELAGGGPDARSETVDPSSEVRTRGATAAHDRCRLLAEKSLGNREGWGAVSGGNYSQDRGAGGSAAHCCLPAVHRNVGAEVENVQPSSADGGGVRQRPEVVLTARRQTHHDRWTPGPAAGRLEG